MDILSSPKTAWRWYTILWYEWMKLFGIVGEKDRAICTSIAHSIIRYLRIMGTILLYILDIAKLPHLV